MPAFYPNSSRSWIAASPMMSKLLINHCLMSQTCPPPNLKLLVSP